MKIQTKKFIEVSDWDELVTNTYNKPYLFQQQEGCQERGIFTLTVPSQFATDDDNHMNDSIPLEINGEEMGVKFDVWLNTNPQTHKDEMQWSDLKVNLFWGRNFYPSIYKVANDLYYKGLIEEGEYIINIDW